VADGGRPFIDFLEHHSPALWYALAPIARAFERRVALGDPRLPPGQPRRARALAPAAAAIRRPRWQFLAADQKSWQARLPAFVYLPPEAPSSWPPRWPDLGNRYRQDPDIPGLYRLVRDPVAMRRGVPP